MESFGYGIIGCGWVSSAHAWGVKVAEPDGVRLVAVVDQDLDRATRLGKRFGAEHIVQDYKAVLDRDDIDAALSVCRTSFTMK